VIQQGDVEMLLARRFASAATTCLLITFGFLPSAASAAGGCVTPAEVTALPTPVTPWNGAPLRVMVITEKPVDGELSLTGPDGTSAVKSSDRHDGPPYAWFAEIAAPAAGTWRATFSSGGDCSPFTKEIAVSGKKPEFRIPAGTIWQVRDSWNATNEALFSAWIAKLFDAPPEQNLDWKVWYEVLRDQSRNFLYNHLGRNEDKTQTQSKPDCADFVYFLRAYFAFKMGLPFGYSNCSRGAGSSPPKCYQWFDVEHPEVTRPPPPPEPVNAANTAAPIPAEQPKILGIFGRSAPPADAPAEPTAKAAPPKPKPPTNFAEYVRDVGDVVHTGAVRAGDDNADFYTVPLTEKALRPGTVFADPYGHVLMLVRRVPEVNGMPGVFLAVDSEPDGSVTRKRFWRGNFLFAHEPSLGAAGFKHFRPIVKEKNGPLKRLSNAEILKNPSYGDYSNEQASMAMEDFYDRMDDVMSPDPLDPVKAMTDAITSLTEQIKTRVTSIENGRKWQQKSAGDATMPDGPSIFATTGAWEDFSTPARDFRLLVAIDMVRGFPDRFARRSDRFALPAGKSVADIKTELQGVLASELASRKITYTRSDGSPWTLSVKDVLARAVEFEMAYNPNDCVELRWAAAAGSDEAATCKRRAPAAQREKMSNYRAWFRDRHWPTRAS
jgi:hypothetical protein